MIIMDNAGFFHFGGIFVVIAGIFTFLDAWTAGIYKKKDVTSLVNNSPAAWGIVVQGLLFIAYPLYLINRNKLKTKDGRSLFCVLTIISGGIPLLIFALYLVRKIASA